MSGVLPETRRDEVGRRGEAGGARQAWRDGAGGMGQVGPLPLGSTFLSTL